MTLVLKSYMHVYTMYNVNVCCDECNMKGVHVHKLNWGYLGTKHNMLGLSEHS